MNRRKKSLFLLWSILFIVSAGFGFIPEIYGLGKALLILVGVGFFVPGTLLLYYAAKEKDIAVLRLIRNISLISLCGTFLLLVANFCSVFLPEAVGVLLYVLLILVSAPMSCCQFWVLSLFLWSCLLMTSMTLLSKAKKM